MTNATLTAVKGYNALVFSLFSNHQVLDDQGQQNEIQD